MFPTPRLPRPTSLVTVACVVLLMGLSLAGSSAQARPADAQHRSTYQPAVPADSQPYAPAISSDAGQLSAGGATAEERYYGSFDRMRPIGPVASSTSPADDDTLWLTLSLAIGVPLLLAGAAAGVLTRRRVRHRHSPVPA